MNQSAFLGGALAAGFVLFLAARNRLTTYAGVLWGPTAKPPGAAPQPSALAPFFWLGGGTTDQAAANSGWVSDLVAGGQTAMAAGL